jgi:hypothetical protein
LALLPLLLALGLYYRPVLRGGLAALPAGGDLDCHIYLTSRMAELGGRWWKMGDDELVGRPYPTALSRHPGIYEGVDLFLVSSVSARWLGPVVNCHALIVLVLMVNGWVAAWMAFRLTGSYGWAALAVVLITLNMPTDQRVAGHLNLFKYCWVLLAVWAFFRYLDAPSLGRGVVLGLTAALVLQGSFYFGFFLLLGLGAWWLGCLASGKLRRQHVVPTAAAVLAGALVGGALTFPVWLEAREQQSRAPAGAEDFFRRDRSELWTYSSEPWQYFIPPTCNYSRNLLRSGSLSPDEDIIEGWNYAGCTVLLAFALYAVARLRGWRLGETATRFLDRAVGLIAVLVLLSLAGGPGALIYDVVPFFRCYGRAGLPALALWSVATPVILHGFAQKLRRPSLRAAILGGALALALFEGTQLRNMLFRIGYSGPNPSWVGWLSRQPSDVRAAVFPFDDHPYLYHYFRALHQHATLNGCDLEPLQADLARCGASLEGMSPEGLRFIVSLGYNALAFREDYLAAHGWLQTLPWLQGPEVADGWSVYRVDPGKLRHAEDSPGLREVPVPLEPVATNRMTWKDGVGEGTGEFPNLVFALKQPQFVEHVRLKYAYERAAGPAVFRMFWRTSAQNDYVEEERNITLHLKTGPGEKELTIPVHDTVDEFRIDPDTKPCLFRIKELVLLARWSGDEPDLARRVREVVRTALPAGARVLVVSYGDDDLLQLGGRRPAGHFPQSEDGEWDDSKPADSAEAIARLEKLRAKGGYQFLLIPEPAFWWLDHYKELKQHLETRYRRIRSNGHCIIYQLTAPKAER